MEYHKCEHNITMEFWIGVYFCFSHYYYFKFMHYGAGIENYLKIESTTFTFSSIRRDS